MQSFEAWFEYRTFSNYFAMRCTRVDGQQMLAVLAMGHDQAGTKASPQKAIAFRFDAPKEVGIIGELSRLASSQIAHLAVLLARESTGNQKQEEITLQEIQYACVTMSSSSVEFAKEQAHLPAVRPGQNHHLDLLEGGA